MIAFLHPALLAALPLALLPLWLRPRPRIAEPETVPFAATRLLAAAAIPAQKRRRHRDWLTTALRSLLLAVIVLGFARPYRGSTIAAIGPGGMAGVTILAEPREFVEAALGGRPGEGPNRLVFLDERTAETLSLPTGWEGRRPRRPPGSLELGLLVAGLRTGEVTVAAGPYFHPGLVGLDDALRTVVVRQWWKLEPVGRTIVLARLSNGDPFLVEHWSRAERGGQRTILCASAADLAWTDLPVQPGFVPLVRGLVGYLTTSGAAAGAEAAPPDSAVSQWLFVLALAIALVELLLAGCRWWKIAGLVWLLVLAAHPRWPSAQLTAQRWQVWRIVDDTDSMAPRQAALERALAAAPPGPQVVLRGDHTALGDALLALTNRPVTGVILFSDGQQNAGLHPGLAALALDVPVFTVAVGPRGGPTSNGVAELRPPVPEENLEGGAPRRHSSANAGGSLQNPESGVLKPTRVYLDAPAPTWEFLHVRHALQRDAGIVLVESNRAADVVLQLTGETWRWRRYGDDVFQRYWSERVRAEYRARHPERGTPSPRLDPAQLEWTRLWRNDTLLEEIARVSAGRMFTDQDLRELPAVVRTGQVRGRPQIDLRDSWLVLLAVAGLFMVSWRPRRAA